jgi:1,2-diacylglycerol 3-beta-glucosyltransferase
MRPPRPAPSRRRLTPTRLIGGLLLALESGLALSSGYLLTLLLAARRGAKAPSGAPTAGGDTRARLVVLIPAHNEEEGIRAALDALALCDYPGDSRRTVVIADNCSDRTADRARDTGAEVWERTEPARRGKGQALIWAFDRLRGEASDFDGVVVLDADCAASPNLLDAIDLRLRSGTSALQVSYVVGNPDSSVASALRFGAFALMNTVRSRGKQRLGLSCGLAGTGMAFTADLLEREPWTATGLTEDAEYHMRLVLAGERVEFVEDASVSSPMPTSLRGSSDQQARWEQGKLQLIGRWTPRLVRAGLARRDVVPLHAGLECLVPPQSLIAAGSLLSLLAGSLLRSRRLVALSATTLAAQLTFVLAGLRLVRAPAAVYRALLAAPALIAAKVVLYVRLLAGRGPTSWTRTEREARS